MALQPWIKALMTFLLVFSLAIATIRFLFTDTCHKDQANRRTWASRQWPRCTWDCNLRRAKAIPSLQPRRALLKRRRR